MVVEVSLPGLSIRINEASSSSLSVFLFFFLLPVFQDMSVNPE